MTTAEAVAKVLAADPVLLLSTAAERKAEVAALVKVAADAEQWADAWEGLAGTEALGKAAECREIGRRASDRLDVILRDI
jgi:hypothetical protein